MAETQHNEPGTYRRREIAERLGISPQSVDRLVERGALPEPILKSGKIQRWDRTAVDAALHGPPVGDE